MCPFKFCTRSWLALQWWWAGEGGIFVRNMNSAFRILLHDPGGSPACASHAAGPAGTAGRPIPGRTAWQQGGAWHCTAGHSPTRTGQPSCHPTASGWVRQPTAGCRCMLAPALQMPRSSPSTRAASAKSQTACPSGPAPLCWRWSMPRAGPRRRVGRLRPVCQRGWLQTARSCRERRLLRTLPVPSGLWTPSALPACRQFGCSSSAARAASNPRLVIFAAPCRPVGVAGCGQAGGVLLPAGAGQPGLRAAGGGHGRVRCLAQSYTLGTCMDRRAASSFWSSPDFPSAAKRCRRPCRGRVLGCMLLRGEPQGGDTRCRSAQLSLIVT